METNRITALVIVDGLGYAPPSPHNPVTQKHMPHYYSWLSEYPHALLQASGTAVGLPDGVPGNSLVGHITLGAGRVVLQPISVLNQAIDDGSFFHNPLLLKRFDELRTSGGTLHLVGLLSDGSSHSHEKHMCALVRLACQRGVGCIVVHAFLDGRDVPPRSAAQYLSKLEEVFKEIGCGCIGSIHGRSYPMDRNERYELIEQSFKVLTTPQKVIFTTWQEALDYFYKQNVSDEFVPPCALVPDGYIKEGDGLVISNIRADRIRALTKMFVEKGPKLLWMITGVRYYPGCPADVVYEQASVKNTFMDVLEQANKSLFVIAEKEKYAHVTYFFNGGREVEHARETRVILPSIHSENFIQQPEMSAIEITDAVIQSLETNPRDFYLINYANPDMIGHTGNFDATAKALECIDKQLDRLYERIVKKMHGTLFIVSDHGKAEEMFDAQVDQPKTSHTTNPVYFMMIDNHNKNGARSLDLNGLADLAPFILQQLHLPLPQEMRHGSKNGG